MPNDPQPLKHSPGTSGRLVRENRPSDAEAIQRILGEAKLSALPTSAPKITAPTQSAISFVHVCESGGEVVAVIQWRQVAQEAEIFDISVDSAHRRHGIASLMLESVLTLAKARGAIDFFLEVRESNTAALALYRKFGFALTGRRSNYYLDPAEAALLFHLNVTG